MENIHIEFDPIKSLGIFTTKLWIRGGSRADPINRKGSHGLISSLMTRGCGPYNNFELSNIVEGCGADLRSETHEDGLLISLKCHADDAYKLIPILGWMIKEPHLSHNQIELERQLTIQTILRLRENTFNLAYDNWRNLVYQDSGYQHDPIGSIKDLKIIKHEELCSLAKCLKVRRKIMVISGLIPDKMKSLVKKSNALQENQSFVAPNDTFDIKYKRINLNLNRSKRFIYEYQETSQVVILIGNPTVGIKHEDDLLLRILSCHLGIGMSSVLFKELREIHGVAYDLGVHHPIREEYSPFLFHCSSSKEKADKALVHLIEIWQRSKSICLLESELNLAKIKFLSLLEHGSQTISQRAGWKAHMLGLCVDYDYYSFVKNRMEEITPNDLKIAALNHLSSPSISLCGPKQYVKQLTKIWHEHTL